MRGWKRQKIGQLFEYTIPGDWGGTPSTNSSVPVVRSTNFRNDGRLDLSDIVYRSVSPKSLSVREVNQGDVLIEKSGGSPNQPAGRVVFCDQEFGGTCSNFIEVAKIKQGFDNRFIFYLLYFLYQTGLVLKYQQQTTGIINFKLNQYMDEFVEVPGSKQEQKEIADVLTNIDTAITQTEALIAKYQRVRTGLMQDLLTKGVDKEGRIRSEETHEFKDSPLGRIPVEWDMASIADTASKSQGSTSIGPFGSDLLASDYRDQGVPVVFVRDIKSDGFIWKSEVYLDQEKAEKLAAHSVLPGDVIATKMGLPPCISCVYPLNMPPGIITADVIRLRPNLEIANAEWLAQYLNFTPVRNQVKAITGGVTRPKVTLRDFRNLLIALPRISEQSQILSILRKNQQRVECEEEYVSKLNHLKSGLMQDLLTGKVSVDALLNQTESQTPEVVAS